LESSTSVRRFVSSSILQDNHHQCVQHHQIIRRDPIGAE
jgi:hypothetical protein